MNYKRKKYRWQGKQEITLKYRHRGMAKTNYRQLNKRKKREKFCD